MAGRNFLKASCSRCGKKQLFEKSVYNQAGGVVYCDDCLVPFECKICGEQRYTIPEKLTEDGSQICVYCEENIRLVQESTQPLQQSTSDSCVLCGKQTKDLIRYQEAPNDPVCNECAPTARKILQELHQGVLNAIFDGALYLAGMAIFLVLTLGISSVIVSNFSLPWWMFFLLTGILLLSGAHWSRIFDPKEIIDLGYAVGAIFLAVWIVFGSLDLSFSVTLGTVVIIALVIHELSHKAIGLGLGKPSEFRAFYTLNLLMIGIAYLTGFLFLAPGGVYNIGLTDRARGIVASAGPISNIILFFLFGMLGNQFPEFARIGVIVNVGLAGFNMLPIPPLDGSKVWRWSPTAYAFIVGAVIPLIYHVLSSVLGLI